MTLVSRGKVGQLGYYGDIVTGPFVCLGTKRKSEWSIQDQQREGNKERHVMLVRDRVHQLVRQFEGLRSSSSEPNILVKPLGLPGPAAGGLEGLARVGKGLDTAWVRDLITIYLLVTYRSFSGWSEYDSLSYSKTWRVDKQWWDTCDRDAIVSPTGCFISQPFILLIYFRLFSADRRPAGSFQRKGSRTRKRSWTPIFGPGL